jgi:hypothetical protein
MVAGWSRARAAAEPAGPAFISTVDSFCAELRAGRQRLEAATDVAAIHEAVTRLRGCALSIVDATIAAMTHQRRTAIDHVEALAARGTRGFAGIVEQIAVKASTTRDMGRPPDRVEDWWTTTIPMVTRVPRDG